MPRGHCWSQEEVRLLLAEIRGSGGLRLLMASTSRPNEALWREICGELAARGYPRNVAQCRAKWKKLKQAFYSEREARRQEQGRPQGLCSPRYYGLLRRLWKQAGRPVFGERRLPDVRSREVQREQQEATSDVRRQSSSLEVEEEHGRQSWLADNQVSANEEQGLSPAQRINDFLVRQRSPCLPEEVQVKEEEGEEEEDSDLNFSGANPAWDMTSVGEQEMSDLSYPDLSPAQRIDDALSRQRSPSQSEPIICRRSVDVSTSPPCRQIKTEPQSCSSPCFPTVSVIEEVKAKEEKDEDEEESDFSISSAAPAWDMTSGGEKEMSNLSYPEFPISQETAGIYPSPAHHHLMSEPQNHTSLCFPTLPIIASVTSFGPSLSIKQETTEREADAPPEHGASPAAGSGTTLGDQTATGDMQGGSVVSLLQSMQLILAQLLHTSQQQQALLESLANDTVSHLNLINDNLMQVGETLQEMLMSTHCKNRVE